MNGYIFIKSPTVVEDIQKYVREGYGNPYIYKDAFLCLTPQHTTPKDLVLEEIRDVLTQFLLFDDIPTCTTTLCLSQNCINYLKSLTGNGRTRNGDGSITQKEIAGGLQVNQSGMLDVIPESIIIGREEGVDIVPSHYNFHSHPKEAYIRHDVPLAWPSAQDYIGFLLAVKEDKTICHLVISIEGIYIISLTTHWFNEPIPLNRDFGTFIKDNYDIPCGNGIQVDDYLADVNSIQYNDGPPLLDVQYLPWVVAHTPFSVVTCST